MLKDILGMNLQYFAEGGDGGEPGGSGAQSVAGGDGSSSASNGSSSASSASSASAGKSYGEQYVKKLIADHKSELAEVEKKAKMTAAEKSKYEHDKAEREMADLKEKNATYEMRDTARSLANDMGFSATADDIKFAAAADVDKTKSNLNYLKSLYDRGAEATKKEYLTGESVHRTGKSIKGSNKKSRIAKLKEKQNSNAYWNHDVR